MTASIKFTIANARELLAASTAIRATVHADLRAIDLTKSSNKTGIRDLFRNHSAEIVAAEIYALPLFDRAVDCLPSADYEPDSRVDLVRHVLELARAAVNEHALVTGGDLILEEVHLAAWRKI